MKCPSISELPPPPKNNQGWPWTEETHQPYDDNLFWPKISIVTTSLNRANFIEETIRGVLLQGYPNLEYIIVDGVSTDGTIDIIERYRKWISFILCEKDRGEYEAVNKGFKLCTGEIITFNSSDDVYLPGTFLTIGALYRENNAYGVFTGGFIQMDQSSHRISNNIPACLPVSAPVDLSTVLDSWRLHQQATFYTRQALDDIGRYVREDLRYTGDRDLLYRVVKRYPVKLIDKPVALFRIHEESATSSSGGRYTSALEYAELQRSYIPMKDGLDGKRKKVHRRLVARAILNRAKYSQKSIKTFGYLIQAGTLYPGYLVKRSYIKQWLYAFGLLSKTKG